MQTRKQVLWCGDSNRVFLKFPENAREDLNIELDRLQDGLMPLDSKPIGAVGPGAFELRTQDGGVQYRVIYVRMQASIFVLHSFTKKKQKTPQHDIETARHRLKTLKQEVR